MLIPDPKTYRHRLPTWILLVGLLGIGNFLVGWWSLLTPNKGHTVYFWFVQFYSHTIIPTLILLPISLIIVAVWASHLTERSWAQVTIMIVSIVSTLFCSMMAFSGMFLSTLRMVGYVEQNNRVYYLVKYDDDRASDFAFCEANRIGFAGHCTYIGWKGDDNDPKIYIDQSTNLVTVESENPSFIWMNSVPPKCINDLDENADDWFVGGCIP